MRQDRVFASGEPISQRVIGGLLGRTFDQLITVEAHLHRIHRLSDVVPNNARSLSIAPVLGSFLAGRGDNILVVGPDAESRPWVRAVARYAGLPWVVANKQRQGDRRVRVRLLVLPPARRAVLIDDIVSSGATLAATARALRRAGVRHIDAIAVHAIVAPGARARLRRAGVRRLLSCDTIPHPSNALSVAPLLASAIGAGR